MSEILKEHPYSSNMNVSLTNYTNTNFANVSNSITNNIVSYHVLFNNVYCLQINFMTQHLHVHVIKKHLWNILNKNIQ